MIYHTGNIKNQYINVHCRLCKKFKIQLEYERDGEEMKNIIFKRMFYGKKHDDQINHFQQNEDQIQNKCNEEESE